MDNARGQPSRMPHSINRMSRIAASKSWRFQARKGKHLIGSEWSLQLQLKGAQRQYCVHEHARRLQRGSSWGGSIQSLKEGHNKFKKEPRLGCRPSGNPVRWSEVPAFHGFGLLLDLDHGGRQGFLAGQHDLGCLETAPSPSGTYETLAKLP